MKQTEKFIIKVVQNSSSKDAVYVGRGSPLGNPFKMASESDRDRVCDEYATYFANKLAKNDNAVLNELSRITKIAVEQGVVRLGCFCAPKRCHGDTIAQFLENVLNPT